MGSEVVKKMMSGCIVGSELAKVFGLHQSYFSKCKNCHSLNKDIKIMKFENITLVDVPDEAREYIKDYTAISLSISDDESAYAYVLPLTNKIKIGFWR